ncbi:MAG: 1-acyl-sn-glycerol-3-phosphate acyltransferase [Cryomorphaceae bacterium]
MSKVLGFVRLLLFALVGGTAMLIFFVMGIFGMSYARIFNAFKRATAALRFVLNIKLTVHGTIPDVQGVIMSNHRSYIDIILIPSQIPYVIVAKKQVKPWPIIGQAAVAIKTIFVDRDSAESRKRTREAIRDRLMRGIAVLIFPEGTTCRGPGVLDYKPGMFRTCASEGFPVIPVAIEFKNKDMAWIGDDTFLRHFIEAFGHWRIEVDVSMGAPLSGNDGDALRRETQEWAAAETDRLAALR